MTNYALQDAIKAKTIAKMAEVVKLGETLSYWTVLPNETKTCVDDEIYPTRFYTVVTQAGHQFSISGGSYASENKITCQPTSRKGANGIQASIRDVIKYGESVPEASCSATREAKAIALDLYKRVVCNNDALILAQAVNDLLAQRLAQGEALQEYVLLLKEQGYTFNNISAIDYWSAQGYNPKKEPRNISVTCYGDVSFTLDVSIKVEDFKNVIEGIDAAIFTDRGAIKSATVRPNAS